MQRLRQPRCPTASEALSRRNLTALLEQTNDPDLLALLAEAEDVRTSWELWQERTRRAGERATQYAMRMHRLQAAIDRQKKQPAEQRFARHYAA